MLKKKSGITLIALIITIIILLILAVVTINIVLGDNGLFNKAKSSVAKYENAQIEEQRMLSDAYSQIKIAANDDAQITISLKDLKTLIREEANPAGTVISYIGSSLPEGYLACDGSKYNKDDYPNLYNALKDLDHTGWAEANWTTEFTVPDLRGEFLRGTGTNGHTNQGSGASVGAHQNATEETRLTTNYELQTIQSETKNSSNTWWAAADHDGLTYYTSHGWVNTTASSMGIDANAPYGYYARPTNTSVLYCIKY